MPRATGSRHHSTTITSYGTTAALSAARCLRSVAMKCHRAWTPAVGSHAKASEIYGNTGWRASDGDAGFRADHFAHDVGEAVDVRVVELLERVPRRRRDVG